MPKAPPRVYDTMLEKSIMCGETPEIKYQPQDSSRSWLGPIPTDPLELVLEYKLGFDDVSDLQAKRALILSEEGRELTPEDGKVLAQALIDEGPCEIEYLFLCHNDLGDEGIEAIAGAMAAGALPKLLAVDFTNNGASDVGFGHLISAVKHCRQFRDIVFKNNKLSDASVVALHEVLKRGEWPQVERVNMAGEQFDRHTISDASFVPFATDLADGVFKMIRLEELEFSDCDVGNDGLAALSTAIERGNVRKLKSLYMQANHITDEGAGFLAAALTNNKRTKLFDIRLGYQNIHDTSLERVTPDGGKAAIEAAGESMGRKVFCVLHPFDAK